MSALSLDPSSLSTSSLPVIDQSSEPASVRNGDQTAKNAYQTGLAFEQMLDNELTQAMSQTISGTDSSDDGLGGTTDTGDSSSSDPAAGAFSSMMPDALTSGLMSTGGTGIAMEIAQAIDPTLANPTPTTTAGATDSGQTTASGGVAATPTTDAAQSVGGV